MASGQDNNETGQPLCCCEYVNDNGEKSHLLGLCCDCQEVDDACDRFLKRKSVENDRLVKVFHVVNDRVRFPTCFGAGARRLDQLLDTTAIPPIVMVPSWIYLASFHIIATAVSFIFVPLAVLLYYRLVLRHRQRTQFFMSWGLTSVFYIYGFFYFNVSSNINITEFSVVTILFMFTLLAFFASKHGPGVVKNHPNASKNLHLFKVLSESTVISESETNVQRRTLSDSSNTDNECTLDKTFNETNNLIGREHLSLTANESTNRESEDWCDVCKLMKPERAGHCRICSHCVLRLDHHCVWIDSCIGADNHRSFLLAAILFVCGGLIGGYLSLSTVCSIQPSQLLDCSTLVYNNRRSAVIFVSIIYTVFATGCVIILLVQQFHLITHNWTYRERKLSYKSYRHQEILHELDKGFVSNWVDFILMRSEEVKANGSLTNV